jgi:hypothetical protein
MDLALFRHELNPLIELKEDSEILPRFDRVSFPPKTGCPLAANGHHRQPGWFGPRLQAQGPTLRRKNRELGLLIKLVNQRERLVGALDISCSLIQPPALRLSRD